MQGGQVWVSEICQVRSQRAAVWIAEVCPVTDHPAFAQIDIRAIGPAIPCARRHWDTEVPTLCHGTSGVLQSTANSDTPVADLAASATTAAYDPRRTFAFQHHYAGAPSDNPGLLTGAAGIALALADHGRLAAPITPTRWDAILLLS